MSLETLTDQGCVDALGLVGARFLTRKQLDLKTSLAFVRASAEATPIPEWAQHPERNAAIAGPVARRALQAMLDGDDQRLQGLARGAIAEQEGPTGEVADLLIAGGFLIALALLSKGSYSRSKGLKFDVGFPDLAKVLDSAGKLLSAIMGGGS